MSRLSRLALLACAVPLAWAAPDASLSQAQAALARLPLRFEANQGQMSPSVRYRARAAGYTMSLSTRGATIAWSHKKHVEISLEGSNREPAIEALDRLRARTDYYLGSREHWRTNVASYSRIRYRGVYPGVDVIYYGNQGQLEYDLVLQPGADPRAIHIRFRGTANASISPEGDLVLDSGSDRMLQKKPVVYQEDPLSSVRHEVRGRYVMLARNLVGLRVEGYDRRRPLVIDPTLVYCTYMGGTGTDRVTAAKLTADGKLYITGSTDSGQMPYIDGAYDNFNDGLVDIFVTILDTTQSNYPPIYFSYLGGTSNDTPLGLDVDSSGVIYLTGNTDSLDFPMAGSSVQTTATSGFTAAFVAKLDPSQYGGVSLVFSTYLSGTTGNDSGNGIAVDKNGLIYVIGNARSSDFPLTANAYAPVIWGPQDIFVCQIDPNAGALVYSTYLGGEDVDDGRAILLDANGLVYFAASTMSTQFPMAGYSYNGFPAGTLDIVVGVMDLSKSGTDSLVYATYFGGSSLEEVRGMAFDNQGNLVITGYTLSSDLPVTPDAAQPQYSGNTDAFVAVLNPSLPFQAGLLYSSYLGGARGDDGLAVTVDSNDFIYVAGYTLSSDFPITSDAFQANWANGTEIFLAKIKRGTAGRAGVQYSTYFGQANTYVPSSVVVGPDGTMYVLGYGGIGLPSSGNAAQGGYAGGQSDGFLLVLK